MKNRVMITVLAVLIFALVLVQSGLAGDDRIENIVVKCQGGQLYRHPDGVQFSGVGCTISNIEVTQKLRVLPTPFPTQECDIVNNPSCPSLPTPPPTGDPLDGLDFLAFYNLR